MAISGASAWFRWTYFIFVVALCVAAGLSQIKDSNLAGFAGFATVVVATGGDPDAMAAADVNHDGAMDIIAANPELGTVSVLLGDGKGHFRHAPGSPFPAGHLPSDIGIGDFNGDGHLDLLIPNHQTPYVTLLLGDGTGRFRAAPHSPFVTNAKPHPHGVAVGHFCGKGEPLDAVIDSWGSGEIEVLIGDGKGNLRNGSKFPAGPGSDMPLGSADLNGDGAPDIVMPDTAIGRWDANTVSVLLGDGRCGFRASPGSPFPAGAVPWSVAIGDINHDGIPDLVMTPYGPRVNAAKERGVTVLLGDGRGGFRPMADSPFSLPGCASPRRVAIGDVRGNGFQDFAVTCTGSTTVLLFSGQAGGRPRVSSLDVSSGKPGSVAERGVLLADMMGRGRDDILVSNGSAGTITLLFSK
jgi:FG-GAP-like repeat